MKSFFTFRAAKIAYQVHGEGSAMLFLHGFLGTSDLWKDQLNELKLKYKVITLDLPGHGDSESLGYMHSMALMADLVQSLLKQLKIRKVVLVGHSMGGYIALAYAEKYTDHLKGLVLVNSAATADTKSKRESRKQLIKMLPKKRSHLITKLVESFFVVQSFQRRYILAKYKRWAMKADPKGIVASAKGMMERREREIILKFSPYPYLIVAGDNDPIISLEQNKKEAKLNVLGAIHIIEDSGHISPLEKPWELNSVLRKFLRTIN